MRLNHRMGRPAIGLLLGVAVVVLALAAAPLASATPNAEPTLVRYQNDATPILKEAESMPAFLNGEVVNTVYLNGYFVGTSNGTNASYGTEPLTTIPEVGIPATVLPASNPKTIEPFWVLVPWFGPKSAPYDPAYNPAQYGIQLDCAPATIGVCWDHPATIFVPGLGVVPLPGHDHLIGTNAQYHDVWWTVIVDLVFNASVFPTLDGSSGITSLAALHAAQKAGYVSADLPTNLFLNFEVMPTHGVVNWTAHPSNALEMYESMPAFLNGKVVNTVYQQGYFTGPAKFNTTFGMEPLLAQPEAGKTSAGIRPDPLADTDTLWVLVPWFGPSSAPYAPAYDPAAYGIQLQCAPATVTVCFDHPATIDIPGLGVVPLPGHDHLVASADGGVGIYWNVIVVLVTDAAEWPNLAGTHGITSFHALREAQDKGEALPDIPTNIWLEFTVGS
ncbi:MAG: hypothetical protein WAN87_06995 [Thermoplasmata archaeon]